MDVSRMQDLFRCTDDGDAAKLREYLHPDLQLTGIGVDGIDGPIDLPSYLKFLAQSIAEHSARGERSEHVPTSIMIEGPYIAVRGQLRITSKTAPDEYYPYFDILKLRDGKIVEYNIAFGI